ncbi:U11/U12 small nuclear ribonucleoprotein 48 kDa protein [Tanacetum coccineum]
MIWFTHGLLSAVLVFKVHEVMRQLCITKDANKNKSREELLAEERDYKRRRMSYRGKKMKRSTTQVFSTWMTFGGNRHDLGSFGEETDKIMDLHQIHEKYCLQRVETVSQA